MRKQLLFVSLAVLAVIVLMTIFEGKSEVFAGPSLALAFAPSDIITPNVKSSGSKPHLNAAGTGWDTFDTNLGAPPKGGIKVLYKANDSAAFPIQAGGATIKLRPSTTDPTLTCTSTATVPAFDSNTAGKCFFRVITSGDGIQIFYLGQLAGNIHYTISGLKPATMSAGTFQDFDSDDPLKDGKVPPPPPSPVAGRAPARLVLALDKSGSMAWSSHPLDTSKEGKSCAVQDTPPNGCGPARWDVLKDALAQMLSVAKAYSLPGDEFGAALFDGTVDVTKGNRINILPMTTNVLGDLQSLVGSRTPGGSTSIGAGVTSFETELSNKGTFTQTILVFTDGDQNTSPYLVPDVSSGLIINKTNATTNGDTHLFPPINTVRVCPFALRADNPSGTLGTEYIQKIATAGCSGLMNSTVKIDPKADLAANPALPQFFIQVLNGALVGDKLELAAVQSGQLVSSAVTTSTDVISATHTFTTSTDDQSFTLLFDWAERYGSMESIQLVKDGVVFPLRTPPVVLLAAAITPTVPGSFALIDEGDTYFSVTMRQPFCNGDGECVDPHGTWQVNFVPYFSESDTFTYNMFEIVDSASLASSFSVLQPILGVKKPLQLEAELREGSAPLTGLPKGSVRAVVARPSSSLGNILSTGGVASLPNTPGDSIGAAGRKAAAMLNDPNLSPHVRAALEAGLATIVPLTEVKPGVYRAQYSDTAVEGMYDVNFFVDARTPTNGAFQRTFNTDFYVGVVPDPAATQASIVVVSLPNCQLAGGCYSVLIRPIDSNGNLLGPGKDPLLFLPPDSFGQLLEPVIDNLDGTYELRVGFPQPITTNPVIEVAGVPIRPPIVPYEQNLCVEGLVITHAEEPLADGRTITATLTGVGGGHVVTRTVDASGTFTFENGSLVPGTWTFAVDVRPDEGWEPVTPAAFDIALAPDPDKCQRIRFKLRQLSTVTVIKVDVNHTPLSDWGIRAVPGPGNDFASPIEGTTDISGTAVFSLTKGHWTFSEVAPPGVRYAPILPVGGRQDVMVSPPDSYTLRFKNQIFHRGCISVTKTDVTAELSQSPLPLPGWRIQVLRSNGTPAAVGTTDINGIVQFSDLPLGPYTVTEESRIGWEPVLASSQAVTLTDAACVPVLFQNHQAPAQFCIDGRVQDANGGIGLPDWTITANPVYAGAYQPAPEVSDGVGTFKFVFPPEDYRVPGARYKVCEAPKSGWSAHTPTCRPVNLPLVAGTCVHVLFINQQVGHSSK